MPTSKQSFPALLALLLLLGRAHPARAQDASARAEAEAKRTVESVYTEDHTVQAGETVDDIIVVGGDLRVLGTITGNAVVVGGRLLLESTGRINGDATVTGGSIVQNGGQIRGAARTLDGGEELNQKIQREVRAHSADIDREARITRAVRAERPSRWSIRNRPHLGSVGDGVFGLISTIALGFVLAGIGAVLVFYGRSHLDTVSDTIRASTLRSGIVGLAASFLVIPAFVILVVALAVSIIGIPFLLAAVPLYPLAVAAAAGMGLLGAAHAIGERTSEQRNDGFDFRYRNSYAYLFTGLGMLLAPLVAANLIEMTGFLGFIGVLLKVVTWMVIWAATTIGMGAVILSRAGTRRGFVGRPLDLGFDTGPGFDTEPPAPHV
jgi:hypothetical protein